MHTPRPFIIAVILITLMAAAVAPAAATRYLYHDLGVLDGKLYSSATDVNNAGQVVGNSWTTSSPGDTLGVTTTYSLLGGVGTMTSLGKLEGATYSQAARITENGQIAGQSEVVNASAPGGYLPRGVYWSSPTGAITNIGTLVGPPPDITGFGSFGWDLNQSGQVSGTSYTGPWNNFVTNHAISWSGGVMTNLGTYVGTTPQPGVAANAMGINDAGQTTGWTNIRQYGGATVPFVRSATGTWTLLPLLPGATSGYGREISESGTKIVGNLTMSDGKDHGVLWTYNGTQWSAQDLGTVGGSVSSAKDLNEVTGQIVGSGKDAGGLNRALIVEDGDTAFQDLTALTDGLPGGVYLRTAAGLNDWSWIVGADSQGHAYLLAPNAVPIPGAVLLFGSGLAGLAAFRFRRR